MKKALHGSGGSTKGVGVYESWKKLITQYNYEPNLISGISVSAILALPVALGKWEEMDKVMDEFTLETIFSELPVKDNGHIPIKAIIRGLLGKSLGKQENIIRLLDDIVGKEDFDKYRTSTKTPDIITMSVDLKSGKRIFVNHKELTYEDSLDHILASSSIPLFTEPVNKDNMLLFDGGMRNHTISHYCNDNFNIERSISVFTRPKDFTLPEMNDKTPSSLKSLLRSIDIMMLEISKSDEDEELVVNEKKNIDGTQIFLPRVLKSLYDTDRERLNLLREKAKEVTDKAMVDHLNKKIITKNKNK